MDERIIGTARPIPMNLLNRDRDMNWGQVWFLDQDIWQKYQEGFAMTPPNAPVSVLVMALHGMSTLHVCLRNGKLSCVTLHQVGCIVPHVLCSEHTCSTIPKTGWRFIRPSPQLPVGGRYVLIGGPHIANAYKMYHESPQGKYLQQKAKSGWPKWTREVSATILHVDPTKGVCIAASSRHQSGQAASEPSTTSTWC